MSAFAKSPKSQPSISGVITPKSLSMLLICSQCSVAWLITCTITTQGSTRILINFLFLKIKLNYIIHLPRFGHFLRISQQLSSDIFIHIRLPATGTNPCGNVVHHQSHLATLKTDCRQPVNRLCLPANEADHRFQTSEVFVICDSWNLSSIYSDREYRL